MGAKIIYLRDLTLLLSMAFYCNSAVLILERYLNYTLSVLVSTTSMTSLCHIAFLLLNLAKVFNSHYGNAHSLVSSALLTTGDRSKWGPSRAHAQLLIGLAFLLVCRIAVNGAMRFLRPSEPNQRTERAPLLVEISFLFVADGSTLMARSLIPDGSLQWTVSLAAIMLCFALSFFYCFARCSIKIESEIHLHAE